MITFLTPKATTMDYAIRNNAHDEIISAVRGAPRFKVRAENGNEVAELGNGFVACTFYLDKLMVDFTDYPVCATPSAPAKPEKTAHGNYAMDVQTSSQSGCRIKITAHRASDLAEIDHIHMITQEPIVWDHGTIEFMVDPGHWIIKIGTGRFEIHETGSVVLNYFSGLAAETRRVIHTGQTRWDFSSIGSGFRTFAGGITPCCC